MIETSRRSFITGLVSFVAAPAIVRAGSLMPVKVMAEYSASGLRVGECVPFLNDWTPYMRYVAPQFITAFDGQWRCIGVIGR